MAAIRLHVQLLEGAPESEAAASRSLIGSEAERIEALVMQWMRFARPEPPRLEMADLAELMRQAALRVSAQAAHANVQLSGLDVLPSAPVKVDRDRLLQALMNVLLNAIQAQPKGGRVSIEIRAEASWWLAHVTDSGTGFSDEALRQLGEPFFSEKEGGMGLGLAVVSEILKAHGGEVKAANMPAGGARVTLQLPQAGPNPNQS